MDCSALTHKMAYIDNSDTKKEMNDAMRGNSVSNIAPTKIADIVQPVININPKDYRRCNIVRSNNAANNTSATIYTTPLDKDFYLVSSSLFVIKDITATSTSSDIRVVVEGVTNSIIAISGITLTPQANGQTISFSSPIKIDRGTNITVINSTNVANIKASGTIIGYTVEL